MLNNLDQSRAAKREQLAKWRASRAHANTLPSGLDVQLRDATVMDLVISGNVPQTLMDLMFEQAASSSSVDLQKLNGTRDFGKLVNALVMACLLDPPVAELGDDDHIGLDELSGADKMYIFEWANREATAVRRAGFQPVRAADAA